LPPDTSKSGVPVERAVDSLIDLHLTDERGGFLVNLGMAFVFCNLSKKEKVFPDLLINYENQKKYLFKFEIGLKNPPVLW
jgi:hypothetical protein